MMNIIDSIENYLSEIHYSIDFVPRVLLSVLVLLVVEVVYLLISIPLALFADYGRLFMYGATYFTISAFVMVNIFHFTAERLRRMQYQERRLLVLFNHIKWLANENQLQKKDSKTPIPIFNSKKDEIIIKTNNLNSDTVINVGEFITVNFDRKYFRINNIIIKKYSRMIKETPVNSIVVPVSGVRHFSSNKRRNIIRAFQNFERNDLIEVVVWSPVDNIQIIALLLKLNDIRKEIQ